MRDHGGELSFKPRLPRALARLTFRVRYRGRSLQVDVRPGEVTYELLDGEPLKIIHDDEDADRRRRRHARVDAARSGPEPKQPPGREPADGAPG